jgi:hypothetical protein
MFNRTKWLIFQSTLLSTIISCKKSEKKNQQNHLIPNRNTAKTQWFSSGMYLLEKDYLPKGIIFLWLTEQGSKV